MLVIAAGNQNHLFRKTAQTGNGPAWRGGNGVVVEPNAILFPHQLNPVLHTAEIPGNLPDGVVCGQALHQCDGRQIVFNVMGAGNQDFSAFQQLFSPAIDDAVFLPDTVGSLPAGEKTCFSVAPESGSNGIVRVENQHTVRALESEDILFGIHILLHILVNIQMVGSQIGDERPLGTALHIHQLERAELHNGKILLFHLAAQRKQGRSDIAAQPDGFPGSLQHLRYQRGCGGFPVGTGDRNQGAGAYLKKHLHLGGHFCPPIPQGLNGRIARMHTGRAEQHIRFHPIQVAIPQAQFGAQLFQLQDLRVQLLPGGTVAARHPAAEFQQQPHQGPVADTQAQHGNLLIL